MLVTQREIREDSSRCELVCCVPVVDELLPPSVCWVGDVGRLVRSWEWRIAENKSFGEKAAENGMHGILLLEKVPFVVQLVIAIFHEVSHQGYSEKLNENLRSVKMRSFRLFKNDSLSTGHLLSRRVLTTIVVALTVA